MGHQKAECYHRAKECLNCGKEGHPTFLCREEDNYGLLDKGKGRGRQYEKSVDVFGEESGGEDDDEHHEEEISNVRWDEDISDDGELNNIAVIVGMSGSSTWSGSPRSWIRAPLSQLSPGARASSLISFPRRHPRRGSGFAWQGGGSHPSGARAAAAAHATRSVLRVGQCAPDRNTMLAAKGYTTASNRQTVMAVRTKVATPSARRRPAAIH